MTYRMHTPPADLAPWIECAWTLQGELGPEGRVILPDGRLELIFHFGGVPLGQPSALIAGRMAAPLELVAPSRLDVLGVRLRPGACGAVAPCDELAPVVEMEAVLGAWARRSRQMLGESEDRVEQLWRLLRRRLTRPPDAAVMESVRRMSLAQGQGAVDAFVPDGLGARQWQRRFLRSTGFGPKTFARLTRFQHLVALHHAGEHRRWAELALEAGFYDQAHLANEFRAFSGQSPEVFFRAGRGMAEFYRSADDGFFQDADGRRR